jgi:hypothetical protein
MGAGEEAWFRTPHHAATVERGERRGTTGTTGWMSEAL